MQEHIRKWDLIVTQVCNSVLVAVLIGFVFYRIGNEQVSINKRQAVLFFTGTTHRRAASHRP